jgi:hypothetical protein
MQVSGKISSATYRLSVALLLLMISSEVFAEGEGTPDSSVVEHNALTERLLQRDTDDKDDKKDETEETEETDTQGRVFGYRNGYLHAGLALHGEWTDNLYNHHTDKVENFLTRVTPSVWLTWPRRSRRPVQIAGDNTSTGGMQYSLTEYDIFNKYQVYLAGKADVMSYSENSDLDHTEYGAEALIQYQPKFRINVHLLDKYTHSQDIFNVSEATLENNRVYDSNIFGLGVDWKFTDKVSLQAAYRHFYLEYEDDENDFLNRTDNGASCGFFYDYSPKTIFFLDYQFLLAAYEEDDMPDNGNSYINLGMNWQATVKTSFMFKAGYQLVNYDFEVPEEYDDAESADDLVNDGEAEVSFEAQANWQIIQKSTLILNTKYSIDQTDSRQALSKTVFVGRVGLDYRLTGRVRADINFIYENSDYALWEGGSRIDDRWFFKPQLQFALRKWLSFNVFYSFDKKDSNFDELDYETNTLGLGARVVF